MSSKPINRPRANLNYFTFSIACQAVGLACSQLSRHLFKLADLHAAFDKDSWGVVVLILSHSIGAFYAARWIKLPKVWQYFNLLIVPAVISYEAFNLPSPLLLTAVVLSVLIYLPTFWTRVPFYPTSRRTYSEIAALLPDDKEFKFIDIGSGFGTLLGYLSKKKRKGHFHGIEISPLPLFLSKMRFFFRKGNPGISANNLWKYSCADYDFVYAFLAPGPMDPLWQKLKKEMKPGSVFISNTFPAPIQPDRIVEIEDRKKSKLYIYKI